MSDMSNVPPKPVCGDPHDVPVTFVNDFHIGLHNGVVNATFFTYRWTPAVGGGALPDPVTTSQQRFNVNAALRLRDSLNDLIAAYSKPDEKPNKGHRPK